jgi:cell division septum initiation protein DivIVA
MSSYHNRSPTLHRERKPGPRVNFGPVKQRLAGVFGAGDDPDPQPQGSRPAQWVPDERKAVTDEVAPRFPLARQGYDPAAVDRHVAELEAELADLDHELAQLRSQVLSTEDVATEIRRIGEQTSEVLITAHEQRGEILRVAREEADRCVAEAQARARAITLEGEARMRGLEVQNATALQERDRLLEDLRTVSAALGSVVDSAQDRIAPENPGASTAAAATTEFDAPTQLDATEEDDPPTDPGPPLAG